MKVYLICDGLLLEEKGELRIKYALTNERKAKDYYDFLKSCSDSGCDCYHPIIIEQEINNDAVLQKYQTVQVNALWIEETGELKYDSGVLDSVVNYPTIVYTPRNLCFDRGYRICQRNKKKVKQWEFSVDKTFKYEGFDEEKAITETIQVLNDFIDRILQIKNENLTTEEAINKATDELYPRKIIDSGHTYTGNQIWNELEDMIDEAEANEDLHGLHDD